MTSFHTLPQDRALPQLARALDEHAMAEVFADELRGHGTQLISCSVERIKYRPNRNCTLSYLLRLRDDSSGLVLEQRVAARLCAGGDSVRRAARASATPLHPSLSGPALRLLPALDMLTWWWPNDAKLSAPHLLADAHALRQHVLPELLEVLSDGRGTLVNHEIEIVQYVPELRLTARVELRWQANGQHAQQRAYAKASIEPDGASAHEILRTLQASPAWGAGRLRTPRALLWQPAHALRWQGGQPGQALLDLPRAEAARLATPLGAQLAALHSTPVAAASELTRAVLYNRLVQITRLLGDALPDSRDTLKCAAEHLLDGLRWLDDAALVTLHGDLHPRNVLADGDRLALIDLDDVHRGPALLELGGWVAEGMYRAVLEGGAPARDQQAWRALLDGYAEAGGIRPLPQALAWACAWNLLCQRAWRCVVNLKPGRFAIAPGLITLAADIARSQSLEVV
jgi:aminoglycoside phosphotransferase (APT) family kinase protein